MDEDGLPDCELDHPEHRVEHVVGDLAWLVTPGWMASSFHKIDFLEGGIQIIVHYLFGKNGLSDQPSW